MPKVSDKQSQPKESAIEQEETNEKIGEAADRLAQLIWDHWLYMQEQKKEKKDLSN
jgi:hypothetical protein